MNKLKYAVQAVIFNSAGEVLAVSRKDNHKDFGLPGGKVDPEDYTTLSGLSGMEIAIIREVKEETGLIIDPMKMTQIFSMHRDGYMGYTYLVHEYEGEVESDEPHAIEWLPFWRVTKGTFGKWNTMVKESLDSMGIEYFDEKLFDAMRKDITEYIANTIRKGYTAPFTFKSTSTGPGSSYVHIKGSDGYEPNGDWGERDEEYNAGLQAIGDIYGERLTFPYYYYCK